LEAQPSEQDRLVVGRPGDASLAKDHARPRRQNHVHHADLPQFVQDPPGFLAQSGPVAELAEGLPEHIGQEAHQDVCLHAVLLLTPDRPQTQIALVDAERAPGLGWNCFSRLLGVPMM